MAFEVYLPKLGAALENGIITDWLIREGDAVETGTPLLELQVDKAVVIVESEQRGVLKKILAQPGKLISLTDTVAIIGEPGEDITPLLEKQKARTGERTERESITTTAHTPEPCGKYEIHQEYDEEKEFSILPRTGDNSCVIIGAGEYSEVIREILELQGEVQLAGYVDDNRSIHGTIREKIPVLGGTDILPELFRKGSRFFIVTVGVPVIRAKLFRKALDANQAPITAVHPKAVVSLSAEICPGTVVEANTVIGVKVVIRRGVFICENCSVSHDSVLEEFCHLAPGVHLGGGVRIGRGALVGVGVSVAPHVEIGANSVITPGSSVDRNVPDNVVFGGVPGRILGKKSEKYRI